jgi:hypothetical protein
VEENSPDAVGAATNGVSLPGRQIAHAHCLSGEYPSAAIAEPMTVHPSDYEQAALHLGYACELIKQQAPDKTVVLREIIQMAARRLSPGDHFVGDAAAEITVLRQIAEKLPFVDARMEILKAIAVLRDRVGR